MTFGTALVYRKITNKNGIEKYQKDLDTLGEWAVENVKKISPCRSKAIRATKARVKNPLGYSLGDQNLPEASSCKYLGMIIRSDLKWVDQVNYRAQRAWKALHFVTRVPKKGNRNTKSLAYTSSVGPVLEYEAACWDPSRAGQINALDRVQTKAAQFTDRTKDSNWETLAQRSTIARLCALFKACSGQRAWKATRDRLRRLSYLSRADRVQKIMDRKQRADIGKRSFVNRTVKTGTNCLQKGYGLSVVNLKFLERDLGKQL